MRSADQPHTQPRRVVLVVDDEPLVRMGAADMFEDLGFAVLEADGAAAALSVLETRSGVDLLFSDCRMPGMSGPELAAVVAERWPCTRIVLTSGYVQTPPRNWPLLSKPYMIRDLERIVPDELMN